MKYKYNKNQYESKEDVTDRIIKDMKAFLHFGQEGTYKKAANFVEGVGRIPKFLSHVLEEREEFIEDVKLRKGVLIKAFDNFSSTVKTNVWNFKNYWWNLYFSEEYQEFDKMIERLNMDPKRAKELMSIDTISPIHWEKLGYLTIRNRESGLVEGEFDRVRSKNGSSKA